MNTNILKMLVTTSLVCFLHTDIYKHLGGGEGISYTILQVLLKHPLLINYSVFLGIFSRRCSS